jgi:murein DD-endopeptidase MepM/ murein hydrolase activator NlpD
MITNIVTGFENRDFRIKQRFNTKVDYTKSGIHGALDIAPRLPGTRNVVLYAPHEGYVGIASSPMLGNHITITSLPYKKEGDVRQSLLAHLASYKVKDGEYVAQGQPVAIMGGAPGEVGSGNSTGIHCHWEYRHNGILTDVEPYVLSISLPTKLA